MHKFVPSFPRSSSELVHIRKRIGKKSIELTFCESIRVNDDKSDDQHHNTAFIDSTVQEKNVTYPTDAKLHKKIVGKVLKIVKELNLPTHQSYTFILKGIYRDQRFRDHPKNRKKAIKAHKRLRTIARCLVRELKRNLRESRAYNELLSIFETILLQHHNSTHKIYSIHEPDVQCINKGKKTQKVRIW